MNKDLPKFNLMRDPWIRCTMMDGSLVELSLWQVLERRKEVRRLAGELATQDYAVLRVLLAAIYGSLRDLEIKSDEVVDVWRQLRDDHAAFWTLVSEYLAMVEPRFQLFDPVAPFMQVAGLRTKSGKYDGVSRLIADIPSGHQYFTTRAGSGLESLSFAEAARWLIHVNAFDPSGIKSGAVDDLRVKGGKGYPIGTGWAGSTGGVYFEGGNLGETLLLNLDLLALCDTNGEPDLPVWERAALGPGEERSEGKPAGPADILTWPSRRVRLFPEYGRVLHVMVSNGDKLAPQNMMADPYTAYRFSKPQTAKLKTTVYMPKEHDAERTLWNGIGSLLIQGSSEARTDDGQRLLVPPAVTEWVALLTNNGGFDENDSASLAMAGMLDARLVGMAYGTQSSVVGEVIDDSLPFHLSLLGNDSAAISETVKTAVAETDNAIWALGIFAGELSQAAGGDPEPPREGIRQRAFFAVQEPFGQWVGGLTGSEEANDVREQWNQKARAILKDQIDQALQFTSTAAVVGREVAGRGFVSAATAENKVLFNLRKHLPLRREMAARETTSAMKGE